MKKIINAVLLAVLLFILLNFLYSNMTPEVLGYPMIFRFKMPGLFTLRSIELPLGFILILSFSIGIIFLAFLQALPGMFRGQERRVQQKKIKTLEKEIENYQGGESAKPFVSSSPASGGLSGK